MALPAGTRLALLCLCTACEVAAQSDAAVDRPPFGSTASTVFDIVRASDPSAFTCLEYIGREDRQLWDKRVDGEPTVNVFLFLARFSDGTTMQIAANPEFGSADAARAEALRYTTSLGQLPTELRRGIERFSIHAGTEGFHAGDRQIIVYSGMAERRASYDHLEESIFHEAVHAAWDQAHRLAPAWQQAQSEDGRFLTTYAEESPDREDLAESALFAFGLLHYPGRIPPVDTEVTRATIPHRIAYVSALLPVDRPLHFAIGPAAECREQAE